MTLDHEQIVRVLLDAIDLGDVEATKRHGVTRRTLQRYRVRASGDPALAAALAARRAELAARWTDEAARVRLVLLARMGELALKSDADLHQVAGAFKLVSDSLLATSVLNIGDRRPPSSGSGSLQ